MAGNVKVTGMNELMANLKNLPRSTQRGVMTRVLKTSATPMVNIAKSKIRNKTGRLAASISVSDRKLGKKEKQSRDQATVYVGPAYKSNSRKDGVNHGHLVEFGTKPHMNGRKFVGTQHPGSAPRPFLRPALEETKDDVFKSLGENMAKEIEASIKRQRKKR